MAFRCIKFPLFLINLLVFSLLSAILAAGQSDCATELNSGFVADRNSNKTCLSPSQQFAFGFQILQSSASANNEDLFLLSIWFDKLPNKTIVWSKNDYPVPQGSRIQLTGVGLILYDSKGVDIWRAEIGNQRSSSAAMLDSGNFVLMNGDSRYIWESFSSPTDTILPGQNLSTNGTLTCRQFETNYKDGRFQLRMQPDGNLVLRTIFWPTEAEDQVYWNSKTVPSNPGSQLIFEDDGYLHIQGRNENIFPISRSDLKSIQDFSYMARLDSDGVFRLYNRPNCAADSKSCTSAWSISRIIPKDICSSFAGNLGSGACGYNSYCVNSNGMPNCKCPEGYSFLDPLNPSGGCKPDFQLPNCQQNGLEFNPDLVDFKELGNTNWPFADYEFQSRSDIGKETCKELCRNDCFCAAAIYDMTKGCWKKRFPFSNGIQSSETYATALIKVPRDNPKRSSSNCKNQSTLVIVISTLLGSSVFINFLMLIAIAVAIFTIYHKKLLNLQSASTINGMRIFTYKELEEATGGFKEFLGRGSFGTVYKGVLPSIPRRYVAIKRLDKVENEGEKELTEVRLDKVEKEGEKKFTTEVRVDKVEKAGEKEFTSEVSVIGQTHHKNLVKLLGYCDEGNHRLLVYEYMCNGSLAKHLFGLSRPHWNQRTKIAFGIARGLAYLHEEGSTQIIHCDIKPQNILLDEYLTPKISDFGMAKLLLSEQSHVARTHHRGTVGYFAPEWFRKASITVKVDVYSFGVMLLEIICCMSSVQFGMGDQEEALIDWVYDCYCKRNLNKLVENDEEARTDIKGVERLVMVAIWCIQEDPSLRPSMRRVAQMLEGVAEVSVPPRPSFFSSSLI